MDWLATKQATKRATTAARYESHLRLHVLPTFGPMPVAAITRHDVQGWINTLARGNLGASTTGDIYRGVFKAVLNQAILDGRLAVSPCHRIELPQRVAEEVVPPTPEQVLAVIGALPLRYRAMAAIAAGAGARISETAGITISRLRGDPVRLRIERRRDRAVRPPAARPDPGPPRPRRYRSRFPRLQAHASQARYRLGRPGLTRRGCGLCGLKDEPACGPQTVRRPVPGIINAGQTPATTCAARDSNPEPAD